MVILPMVRVLRLLRRIYTWENSFKATLGILFSLSTTIPISGFPDHQKIEQRDCNFNTNKEL
jgi:hypothetical protein